MTILPPEILHKIFIQLDLQQRLLCLTVCSSWWRVLDKYSLFYDVDLYQHDDNSQLNRFMANFNARPACAAQVEELDVFLKTDDCLVKRELFKTFPNVRVIRATRIFDSERASPHVFTNHQDWTFPTSKLESLDDFDHCELLSQVLYANLGGRLKTLDLEFLCISGTPDIVLQLKNLPVLKKLTLRSLKITVDALDKMHESVLSVEDFSLYFATIGASTMPSSILPATAIRKFTFCTGDFNHLDTHSQFYRYMSQKYTNLTEIDHEDKVLNYYCVNYRRKIYLNGLLDFLKLIGPIKKELDFFALPDGINPFDALDSVDTRLEKLHLNGCDCEETLRYLSKSNQTNHITTLEIFNTKIDALHPLQSMTVLTSLTIISISPNEHPLRLVDCLVACPPSLKSLAITAKDVIIEPYHTQLESIENLEFSFGTLTNDLAKITTNCFPNLVTFKLFGGIPENIHITLKSPRFQKARFSTVHSSCIHGFAFKSPNQTETQYYIGNEDMDLLKKRQKRRVEYEEIAHLPILSVESLKDAKLELQGAEEVISY